MPAGNQRLKVVLVIGAVWVVASAAVYLLAVSEPTSVQRIAFGFLIFSEILTTALLARLETTPPAPAYRMGLYGAASGYLVLAAGTAVIHLTGLVSTATWLWVVEILLLAFLATVLILLRVGTSGAAARDGAQAGESAAIGNLIGRLEDLVISGGLDEPLKAELKKVLDEARYLDRGARVPADATLVAKVSELEGLLASKDQAALDGGPARLVGELGPLVALRRRQSSEFKRGGR
jgi:hypothetical protein